MILKEKLILDDALLKWAQPLTYTAVKCKIRILRNLLQLSHSSKNYRRSYKRKTLTGIILLQNEHIYFSYFHTFSNRTYIIFESRTFTCGRELSQRVIGAFTCRKVIFGVLFLMWYTIVLVRLLNKKKASHMLTYVWLCCLSEGSVSTPQTALAELLTKLWPMQINPWSQKYYCRLTS